MPREQKSCLIISYGPVPTPEFQTVEGGGMRAWGLARGLQSHGIDVTVAINSGFPQTIAEHEGVRLINWNLDASFTELINSFDAVIISYCMGDPSIFVADHINDDIQLILDCYVPIYIEVSARDSKDVETEYVNYMVDIQHWNRVLKRGDYFLYANDAQELMYSGVLGSLGVINPHSYRQQRLLKTPFGIHREPAEAKTNPYAQLGITDSDFVVLWFGGIYPWFNIDEYLAAIAALKDNALLKFVFVGGKNPFNPNPDFSRQYDLAVKFAEDNKLTNQQMFFIDWVDFNDRVDWYARADVVISVNQPGNENKYSWRTRVMDYVWGGLAIISNGMDPLSEELLAHDAAIRLPELSAKAISTAILSVQQDPKQLKTIQANIQKVQQLYFWDVVTTELSEVIMAGALPYQEALPLAKLSGQGNELLLEHGVPVQGGLSKLAGLPLKVARKVRQKGVLRTAKIGAKVIKTQLKQRSQPQREPQFVFISHPINNTGAPIVLLQMVAEYVQQYGAKRVRVIAPGIEKEQKAFLNKLGISVEHAVFGVGFRFIRLQLALQKDDFVLMNTAAIYDNYRDFVLLWLRSGRLRHAYWFVHEDLAQLPYIHKEFLEPHNLDRTAKMLADGKLTMLVPSQRTAQEYNELLQSDKVTSVRLHVEVPAQYTGPRPAADYAKINFLLSGTPSDGRKGQLLALAAFEHFSREFYAKKPADYRDFSLQLVAIGDDYLSQQIKWISQSLLADHAVIHPSVPKDEAMALTAQCNAVICCSLNETFGLNVAEGMHMGHVVLRNDSAGVDEQLQDGVNGYAIDHTDIKQFAAVIEKILNKQTTDAQLQAMGAASQQIIKQYGEHSYLQQISGTT